MNVLASLEILPVASPTGAHPTGDAVVTAQSLLKNRDLKFATRATVTEIEGELADILHAVEQLPPKLHDLGQKRVVVSLKIESDADGTPSLDRGYRVPAG